MDAKESTALLKPIKEKTSPPSLSAQKVQYFAKLAKQSPDLKIHAASDKPYLDTAERMVEEFLGPNS